MINLLPPEILKQELSDYRRRRLIVVLYLLLSLEIISIIIGASAYWLRYHNYRQLEKNLSGSESSVEAKEYETLAQALEHSQRQLAILAIPSAWAIGPVDLVELLASHQRQGIAATSITYQVNKDQSVKSEVRGLAATRTNLLKFIEALKTNPSISAVDSPINNLIKDREISFVIRLEVKAITTNN